jgi:thioredoxin 1
MKTILLLATLTLLASCTKPPEVAPTPVPETKMIDENKDMPEAPMMKDQESMPDAMMKDDMKEPLMMSGEMMDQSGMDMKEKETMMMKPTGYVNYDEMKVNEALASGQKVALFFHATWCPTCKALEKSINTEISSIPSDALIVKVDYDTSTEMKKKYGVTSQHTTVLIDKDMNLISKKLGARNISEVLN